MSKKKHDWLTNFSVNVKSSKKLFRKFQQLCRDNDIVHCSMCDGGYNYYGVRGDTRVLQDYGWGRIFSITQFEEILTNKASIDAYSII